MAVKSGRLQMFDSRQALFPVPHAPYLSGFTLWVAS